MQKNISAKTHRPFCEEIWKKWENMLELKSYRECLYAKIAHFRESKFAVNPPLRAAALI